jgi:hypothetical protein
MEKKSKVVSKRLRKQLDELERAPWHITDVPLLQKMLTGKEFI